MKYIQKKNCEWVVVILENIQTTIYNYINTILSQNNSLNKVISYNIFYDVILNFFCKFNSIDNTNHTDTDILGSKKRYEIYTSKLEKIVRYIERFLAINYKR